MTRTRLGILISGAGTNMTAIIEAARASNYPAHPVLVVSNRPDAAGLQWAKDFGVETAIVDHKSSGVDREAFERCIDAELRAAGVELVALAGFMRILTPWMVGRWAGRMVNIHPSLLPKYKGLHTHARALDAGDEVHGCSVHWVSQGVDEGSVIAQAEVPVFAGDNPETLAARVQSAEHKLYPEAIRLACAALQQGSA